MGIGKILIRPLLRTGKVLTRLLSRKGKVLLRQLLGTMERKLPHLQSHVGNSKAESSCVEMRMCWSSSVQGQLRCTRFVEEPGHGQPTRRQTRERQR